MSASSEPLRTGGDPRIEEWNSDDDAKSVVTRVAYQAQPVSAEEMREAALLTGNLLRHSCTRDGCSEVMPCPECLTLRLRARVQQRRSAGAASSSDGPAWQEEAAQAETADGAEVHASAGPMGTQNSQTSTGWTQVRSGLAEQF